MIKTFAAVKAICIYSDWAVSNLSVQKLLYICHMHYLGQHSPDRENLSPLIQSPFYAWAYGPVVREVYQKLKMFGADEVENFSTLWKEPDPDEEKPEYQLIQTVCDQLRGVKPHRLIAYTHSEESAWKRFYNVDAPNTVIPDTAIYDEYQARYPREK